MVSRLVLAVLLPFIACAVQWVLWDAWIKPYVWFLFFPAAFFSAWLGGLRGGLAGTVTGALLVWYFYIPPQFSFRLESAASVASIVLFVIMGGLFSWLFERLTQAMNRTDAALAESSAAKDKITELYTRTLELDDLKSQFFANISHELRTPLTLILGPVRKMIRDSGLTDEDRRSLEVVARNARLLIRHVSDLLDVSKLEAGRMVMTYSKVDLARLVRFVSSHFDLLADEKKIDYDIRTPETLPAEIDTEKCSRILFNLLSNAFKFTPEEGSVTVSLFIDNGCSVIEVKDSGPGVPPDKYQAIFEPFRQLDGGAERRYGGTGLGLAIVKEFVELHKGSIDVSEPLQDSGSVFTVRVPLKAPEGTVLVPEQDVSAGNTAWLSVDDISCHKTDAVHLSSPEGAPMILVVEDNPDMVSFLAAALAPQYRVETASDGREGLAKTLSLHPDLILSDVMMPSMSGDAMALELKANGETKDIPIIMLTAKADDDLRVKLIQAGVDDFINKPFSLEELLAKISGLVTKRRQTIEEILRINSDLERRVAERTAELTAANQELDAFAYAVSHDLRAPLRAMSGFSNALMEDHGDILKGEAREHLDQIDIASRQMGQLIDGLLALSRSTRGELLRERVDISALSDRILSDFAEKEPARRVLRQVEQGLTVYGDSRMLEALMVNLLNNAWKYTSGTAAPLIRVYSEYKGSLRHICVADNGAGFDMKYSGNLFKPFKRLHRQDEFPGIGIGLATAQRIVHRHGGSMSADGNPGQGATFRFSLL